MLLMTDLRKYVLPIKKDINVKVIKMITRKMKAKMLVKHISCDFKCKFNSLTCNSIQKWNNDKCQCKWKKILVGILAYALVRIVVIRKVLLILQ